MQATLWLPMRGALNRWRRAVGLAPHRASGYFAWVERRRIPTVYGYSQILLPDPAVAPPHHLVSGYWFLDPPPGWAPPLAIERFLAAGPPPVAIGFGSMDDQRPDRLTNVVLEALRRTGQRAIIIAGWAGIGSGQLPPGMLRIDAIHHSWLFPQVAAVVHHGGAGTTAAGLRAGVPSVIAPFVGDQPFWARRVAALGAGVAAPAFQQLSADSLAAALARATSDPAIGANAARLGQRLRAENGAAVAAAFIERVVG